MTNQFPSERWVDMENEAVTTPELTHQWKHQGKVITFSWLGDAEIKPDRVYGLAFTPAGKMLLVTDPNWDPAGWLPGGGVEAGETSEEALARELLEEANATLHQWARIGAQLVEDSAGRKDYHGFYWCRITLASEYSPEHEVTQRYLISPDEFLDRLFWGRVDPKAALLLERALNIEQNNGGK